MAARWWQSLIFISTRSLKTCLRNWFEILHIYWYILDKGEVWFWTWSESQYGRQVAILDFRFRLISQEVFEQSTWNFAGLLVHIRWRSGFILDLIGNWIWPPILCEIFQELWHIGFASKVWTLSHSERARFKFGPHFWFYPFAGASMSFWHI